MKKMVAKMLQGLRSGVAEMIQEAILDSIHSAMRGVLKRLILAILGALLASFGIICVLMGLLKFLTLVMPEWMAWIVIGSHALLIGALAVVISMPRRR
jgi:hypothetical protein